MKTHRLTFIFFLAATLGALGQAPEPLSVTASIVNPRIVAGEVGALQIIVRGGVPDRMPREIEADNLVILYNSTESSSREMTIINGKVTTSTITYFYYQVIGNTPGDYVIPSFPVKIGGAVVESNPVNVRIVRSDADSINPSGPRFARLRIPDQKIYVNQIFPLDAVIYLEGRNALQGVTDADLEHDSFVKKRFEKVDMGSAEISGRIYSTAVLPTTMFALKSGQHQLGPALFKVKSYEVNSRMPLAFTSLKIREVKSDVISVNVLPLPPNAPTSFTGGVGDFAMENKASPLNLKVGDPISLEFTIRGKGNLETMSAPVIPGLDPDSWKTYEAKKEIRAASDGISTGTVVFSQVIIPLRVTDAIPSAELTFFDPSIAQYVAQKTVPTPITVAPDTSVTSAPPDPEPSLPTPAAGETIALPAGPHFQDILHIRPGKTTFRPIPAQSSPPLFLGIINGLLGLAFAGLCSLVLVRKYRSSHGGGRPQKLAFKSILPQIKPGADRSDFYHATLQALELWEKENPPASPGQKAEIQRLREKCETALYSKHSDQNNRPVSTAEAHEFMKSLKSLSKA